MKLGAMMLFAFLFGSLFQLYAQDCNSDTSGLRSLFQSHTERWRLAYNSHQSKQLLPLYTADAVYISSHVPGLVTSGKENVAAYFQRGMDLGGFIESVEVIGITRSGDLVNLLCRYKANNAGEKVEGRNLLVLRKANGEWLISMHLTVVK